MNGTLRSRVSDAYRRQSLWPAEWHPSRIWPDSTSGHILRILCGWITANDSLAKLVNQLQRDNWFAMKPPISPLQPECFGILMIRNRFAANLSSRAFGNFADSKAESFQKTLLQIVFEALEESPNRCKFLRGFKLERSYCPIFALKMEELRSLSRANFEMTQWKCIDSMP